MVLQEFFSKYFERFIRDVIIIIIKIKKKKKKKKKNRKGISCNVYS